MGKWYEIQQYPFVFSAGATCMTQNFTAYENGTVSVFNNQTQGVNLFRTSQGIATVEAPGVWLVNYSNSTFLRPSSTYYILDTDYNNYAIIFACYDVTIMNFRSVWVLSRSMTLTEDLLQQALKSLDIQKLSRIFLLPVRQSCSA